MPYWHRAIARPKKTRESNNVAYDPKRALELLRIGSGRADSTFRDGQEDAIRHIIEGKGRLLVVQKTGWGKSFVYFIATKLLRESGNGPALLISPLLALMRNQIPAMLDDRQKRLVGVLEKHWELEVPPIESVSKAPDTTTATQGQA